jgi:hypothetical protein
MTPLNPECPPKFMAPTANVPARTIVRANAAIKTFDFIVSS